MEMNLQDEAGWNCDGRIWLNDLKTQKQVCLFVSALCACDISSQLFKISLLDKLEEFDDYLLFALQTALDIFSI